MKKKEEEFEEEEEEFEGEFCWRREENMALKT